MNCDRRSIRWSLLPGDRWGVEELEPRFSMDASFDIQLLGSPVAGSDSPVYTWSNSLSSYIADTEMASFADGSHLIAYVSTDGGSTRLYARRSDIQGQSTTDPVIVHDFGSMFIVSGNITVRVATFSNGEYAILWRDSESLSGQRYYASGQAAGDAFLVTPTQTTGVFGFDVATKSNGHLYVIWANGRRLPVMGVELDTQGNQVQPPKPLVFPTLNDMLEEVKAAPGANDGVVLSWGVAQSNPTGIGHKFQAFDSQLNPLGTVETLTSPTSGMAPEMLRLGPNRNVWAEHITDVVGNRLQVQLRDDQGNLIAPAYDVSLNSSTLLAPQLTRWPGRGFLLTYLESDELGHHVYARVFNQEGAPLSTRLLVTESMDLPVDQFRITGLTPDRFGVAWIDNSSSPLSHTLKERTWQLATIPLSVKVNAPDGMIDPSTHEIVVSNLPATVGLQGGVQDTQGTWRLSFDQAAQLQLVTYGPWPTVRFTLSVVNKATGELVIGHDLSIGTDLDDQFFLPDDVQGQVLGMQGYNQLVLPGASTDYVVEALATGQFHLTSTTQTTDLFLSEVDAVMLADGLFTIEDLIPPPPDPDPIPPDPVVPDPVVPDPVIPDPELPDPGEPDPTDPAEEPSTDEDPSITDDGGDDEETDEDAEEDNTDTDLLGLYVFNGNVLTNNQSGWEVPSDVEDMTSSEPLDVFDSSDTLWQDLDWLQWSDASSDLVPLVANQNLDLLGDTPSSPADESPADSVETPEEAADEPPADEADPDDVTQELAADDEPLEAPLDTLELSDAEAALYSQPNASTSRGRGAERLADSKSSSPVMPPQSPRESTAWNAARQAATLPSTLFETVRVAARTHFDDRSERERRETVHEDGIRFHSPELNVTTRFASQELFTQMDTIDREVEQDVQHRQLMVGTAVVVATGFSVAQIAWLLRGSLIITQTLSSLPIWIGFDPLPVLNSVPSPGFTPIPVGNDESLLDLVRR